MTFNSVSKLLLELEINNKTFQLQLKRHLAPSIIRLIHKCLPINNVIRIDTKNSLYISLDIREGIIRPRRNFNKCDVAYNSLNSRIYFFLGNVETKQNMTLIGMIISNCEFMSKIKNFDTFRLYSCSNT
ncbi:MAG: hypothetical protein OXF28_00315 [Thaumarchaeota archaeon]|nr:hypothetical protein [Nitrososphaerota archaeon]MCY3975566.1 hypothetical protein [Nitrososphaerota archaeon]